MSEAAVRALQALARNSGELTEFDLGVIVGKAEKIGDKDVKRTDNPEHKEDA